jgi:UTP-glucose-1-phosphate uridylyltransferase
VITHVHESYNLRSTKRNFSEELEKRELEKAAIFNAIERTHPGKGKEVQLTDALRLIRERIYAYVYRGRRYDIGNKLDWLKSNIELSLRDERFDNELGNFLRAMIKDEFPS